MANLTVQDSISNWTGQLNALLNWVSSTAESGGWHASFSERAVQEEPTGTGTSLTYAVPVLELSRVDPQGNPQRVTFEPRHRFTILATGRIDVYSYPALREAMLLRILNVDNPETLTWEAIEGLVAHAPWAAFSMDRLPLSVDLGSEESVRKFLSDLAK
jgi:hypothetical protein